MTDNSLRTFVGAQEPSLAVHEDAAVFPSVLCRTVEETLGDSGPVSFCGCFARGFATVCQKNGGTCPARGLLSKVTGRRGSATRPGSAQPGPARPGLASAVKYFPGPALRQRAPSYRPWRGLGNVAVRSRETGRIYQR